MEIPGPRLNDEYGMQSMSGGLPNRPDITWHYLALAYTVTLISVLGRRMIIMGTTGWRRGIEGR